MKSSLTKAKWKRLPSMAAQREAARYFGAATKIAASIWRNIPKEMKRLMDPGAYNRLVGTIRIAQGEDGNVADFEAMEGLNLNEGSMAPDLETSRYTPASSQFAEATTDPQHQGNIANTQGSYSMAQRFIGAGVVHCPPTDENLGSIQDLRNGIKAIQAQHASQGQPQRRIRTWRCICEIGTVECASRSNSGRFLLVQRGTGKLGRGHNVTDWQPLNALSSTKDSHPNPTPWAGLLRQGFTPTEGPGIYLLIEATEVAEKRGRHWVRMPYACSATITEVLEQDIAHHEPDQSTATNAQSGIQPGVPDHTSNQSITEWKCPPKTTSSKSRFMPRPPNPTLAFASGP